MQTKKCIYELVILLGNIVHCDRAAILPDPTGHFELQQRHTDE